ncbi:MAG: squalene synthase HpnC [Planctomycetaceae bacterium]|nr:squalene synthase HpnC [Planctomycetaceae bacterium]
MPTDFARELTRWGPARTATAQPTLAESQTYCRRLATSHYENFPVVTWMLPRELHQHFYNIYAYCRWSDDLGDEVGDDALSLRLLAWWRDELHACYEGRTSHPVYIALAATIAEFAIPAAPFEDLISAFEQDQRVKEYETFEQLRDYCRRSADPVGRLVLALCRQATDENFGWSDSICTGLQLANFWQDVARDHAIGRIYLPREDRERFGYSADDLRQRVTNSAFLELMQFEVDRARQSLRPWRDDRRPELACFPFRVQVDLELFSRGGETILDRIAGIGYRVWDRRPVVTKFDVLCVFVGAMASSLRRLCVRRV